MVRVLAAERCGGLMVGGEGFMSTVTGWLFIFTVGPVTISCPVSQGAQSTRWRKILKARNAGGQILMGGEGGEDIFHCGKTHHTNGKKR